ncbi:molybdopterin converting factor subunit 1 [Acidihalobacter aeolianus]|uniref:Molybdopterin synthase sulfur carrier subunit n=1 Tax=Acidihalobacter aeolianus TaxID=2792603 RepID=A0A1D8K458_9GAMM|nr:molybdopterin converting factor subunit 1 [Acidihalobacter aeolianus]AOV15704.1 molybdopterin converting factor subunit 1 [Acidihalobacter aeolianus]
MSITVRYFASLRDRVGRAEEQLDAAGIATVGDVRARIEPAAGTRILAALNQEYVGDDHPVVDGDEVAFFPPVTGG